MKRSWQSVSFILTAILLIVAIVVLILDPVRHYQAEEFEQFDVVVIGGEPEGVAAAVAAARNGANTLLVEHRNGLGGLMTYGMLNYLDLGMDRNKNPANAGIFAEWHEMVGGGISFNIEDGKKAFMDLVKGEPNLTLSLQSTVREVNKAGQEIESIIVATPEGDKLISAKRFIDSTADADFAALARVPYFVGQQDIGMEDTEMSVTLMIHLKNVNWNKLKEAARRGSFGGGQVHGKVIWGFWGIPEQYRPSHPLTRVRGLNIARQDDGTVFINALQIFDVDPLDEASKAHAMEIGKEETRNFVRFLRDKFPGFEHADIVGYPPELYIRESRHIRAIYQLPISDVWENNDHWDSIGFGVYPVDMQATEPNGQDEIVINPTQYAIPFRSLVPLEVENLLVASRSSGYSSLAAGSARIIPTGMTAGEAAGIASVLSIEHDEHFHKMAENKTLIKTLQGRIMDQGGNLYSFNLSYPYEGKWYYPALKTLYSRGLIFAGYRNNLRLDDTISEHAFLGLMKAGLVREGMRFDTSSGYGGGEELTRDQAAEIVLKLLRLPATEHPWGQLYREQIIDEQLYNRLQNNKVLNKAEAYVIAAAVLQRGDGTT